MIVSANDDFPEPFLPNKQIFFPGVISKETVLMIAFSAIETERLRTDNISARDIKHHIFYKLQQFNEQCIRFFLLFASFLLHLSIGNCNCIRKFNLRPDGNFQRANATVKRICSIDFR